MTPEYCRELFNYDSQSGDFTWRVSKGQRARPGVRAGHPHCDGYLNVQVDGRKYLMHRLAWIHFYGTKPPRIIDHIDGNRSNNAIANLRSADNSMNSQNIKKHRSDNLCGLLGASRNGNGWKGVINLHGVRYHLGTFPTPEEAHAAYIEAKRQLHPANTL